MTVQRNEFIKRNLGSQTKARGKRNNVRRDEKSEEVDKTAWNFTSMEIYYKATELNFQKIEKKNKKGNKLKTNKHEKEKKNIRTFSDKKNST